MFRNIGAPGGGGTNGSASHNTNAHQKDGPRVVVGQAMALQSKSQHNNNQHGGGDVCKRSRSGRGVETMTPTNAALSPVSSSPAKRKCGQDTR